MHTFGRIFYAIWLVRLAGVVEALLLARFTARIAAARPDHPLVDVLYTITGPLVSPLAFFDAGQPLFGASLERSTLAIAIVVPLLAYLAWILLTRSETARQN